MMAIIGISSTLSKDFYPIDIGRLANYGDFMAKTFCEAFNEHLEASGVKITEIANATGVNKDSLYKLKYGRTRNMGVDDAIKVAAFFGETVEEFMGVGPGGLRDVLLEKIAQLSERERRILEVSITAVLASRDADTEPQESDQPTEEAQ